MPQTDTRSEMRAGEGGGERTNVLASPDEF